jgi:heparanase
MGAVLGAFGLSLWLHPAAIVQNLGKTDPIVSAGLSLAYGRSPRPHVNGDAVSVQVHDVVRRQLDPRFLSFAIDTSQVLGGHWWSERGAVEIGRGARTTPPLDLSRPELVRLAQALAPAYLRVGGTEADHVYYALDQGVPSPLPRGYELVLTAPVWDGVARFTQDSGLDLYFTVNAGPGPRDARGSWHADNLDVLVRYAHERQQHVAIWELGNEVNGHWFIHGLGHQPSGAHYAQDLKLFKSSISPEFPESRLAGPANLFLPVVGDVLPGHHTFLQQALEHSRGQLDIVSWHFYPQQSRRCPAATRRARLERLLDPAALDESARWGGEVLSLRDNYSPGAEVWLGETGHAQCGGEPGVSDRYVSGLWWLDQLGAAARDGQSLVVRQTLVGSDYGLVDDETLTPNPDYFNSVLWKKLMGTRVLTVDAVSGNPYLRVYAHCDPAGRGGVTLLALNLHPQANAELLAPQFRGLLRRYLLDAPTLDSRTVRLNGRTLTWPNAGLPDLSPEVSAVDALDTVLEPSTYVFLNFPEAGLAACGYDSDDRTGTDIAAAESRAVNAGLASRATQRAAASSL